MAFSGLSIALSALHAQQRAMEVAGHNVANANTAGYSRQRVDLAALGGQTVPAIFATWRGGGAGVTVEGIARLRDAFLEARGLQEHASDAGLRKTQQLLSRVELVFGEPGDQGIAAQLADFWAGWDDVANRPGDLAARAQLVERARTLVTSINQAYADLGAAWAASLEQVRITVDEVNATAARVAELNAAIERAVRGGLSPNDLADQRDLLVQQLAERAGAVARPGDNGVVDVFVGGTALVRGAHAEQLAVHVPAGAGVATAAATPVEIRWAKDGYPAAVSGGEAGALLAGLDDVLPRHAAGLDEIAAALASTVNAAHTAGVDLAGMPGSAFFTGTTAATLTLAVTDPTRIAAAAPGAGGLDGSNAAALADLASAAGGPDERYRSFIVRLGVEAQAVSRRVEIQAGITEQVDRARQAEAGVNLDEEMANMVAFQHAYEAAARFLSSVDEMLDTLVNRTGLVGR